MRSDGCNGALGVCGSHSAVAVAGGQPSSSCSVYCTGWTVVIAA